MKKANFVLSILILLFALVSAVFSCLFFAKRGQMVDGWRKMAGAINQNAREMDQGSGTQIGNNLTEEALSHENYAELDQKLAKLTQQSRDLIKQRDLLAASLQKIGETVEMKKSPEKNELQALATYEAARDAVSNGASDLVDRRNKIADAIVNVSRTNLHLTGINSEQVRTADSSALKNFTDRMNQFGRERSAFEDAMALIYRQCGGQGSLDFSGDDFAGELGKGKQAVATMKEQLDKAIKITIPRLEHTINQRNGQIKDLNGTLDSTTKALSAKSNQYERLCRVLGQGEEKPIPQWESGSPEARKLAVGRVVDVSKEYGYIAIDLGSESTVPQQRGETVDEINLAMAQGLEMVVSRGDLEVPTSEFITKVKITKVDSNCSIAEPFGDQKGTVSVGDKVWFDIK